MHFTEVDLYLYHIFSGFQFLWMDDPDTVNNIMLAFITMPYIMVLDPLTHLFYVPDQSIGQITAESIGKFLEDIKAEKVEVIDI